MRDIIIFGLIFFAFGVFVGSMQLSYRIGLRHGVERTEQCMDNWGKMKRDSWDFFCLH